MRKLKYLALVLVLLVSIALPLSNAYADSGPAHGVASDMGIGRHGGEPDAAIATGPHFTALTGDLQPVAPGHERYAIVIGSNYYSIPDDTVIYPLVPPFGPHLNWAENDATAMAGLLSGYGFDSVTTLIGSSASRANILNAIETVKGQAQQGDEVVFYFSGHGAQKQSGEGAGSSGIVTDEGTGVNYLWDSDLAQAFSNFETDRIVFIFDECFSGGMTDLASPGRLVLSATTQNGVSVEDAGPHDPSNLGVDHGFFTFFLMAALTGTGAQANAMVSAILGVPVNNPYQPAPGATVSMEQAFDYASYELQAVSPLVRAGLSAYYGPRIAARWGTPTVIDRFKGDLVP